MTEYVTVALAPALSVSVDVESAPVQPVGSVAVRLNVVALQSGMSRFATVSEYVNVVAGTPLWLAGEMVTAGRLRAHDAAVNDPVAETLWIGTFGSPVLTVTLYVPADAVLGEVSASVA